MSETKNDKKGSRKSDAREDANALISSRLRGYYNTIVEEGTPDHLLDLLQKLAEAELASQKKGD